MANDIEGLAAPIFGDRAYWPAGWKTTLEPVAASITALQADVERLTAERDAARAQGYAEAKEQAIAWLKADAERCDCAALEERDCACGAWAGYKTVAMTDLIDRFEPAIRAMGRGEG